jgi:hypothetical protein
MNRSSALVATLVEELAARDVHLRPRRFEGWAAERLDASPGLPMRVQLEHYANLAELSASGRSSAHVALRMAARGYTCPRLREDILQQIGLDDATEVQPRRLDLSAGESGDEGFAFVEQIAHAMADPGIVLPRPMSVVIDALRRNAGHFAEQLGESPDSLFHSFLVNGLCQLLGEQPYNLRAMAAVLNVDPDTLGPDFVELAVDGPTFDVAEINKTYLTAPLDSIAAAAHWVRRYVPEFLNFIGADGVTDAEMDEIAATFSPMVVYALTILQRLSEHEAEAVRELLPGMPGIEVVSVPRKLAG